MEGTLQLSFSLPSFLVLRRKHNVSLQQNSRENPRRIVVRCTEPLVSCSTSDGCHIQPQAVEELSFRRSGPSPARLYGRATWFPQMRLFPSDFFVSRNQMWLSYTLPTPTWHRRNLLPSEARVCFFPRLSGPTVCIHLGSYRGGQANRADKVHI